MTYLNFYHLILFKYFSQFMYNSSLKFFVSFHFVNLSLCESFSPIKFCQPFQFEYISLQFQISYYIYKLPSRICSFFSLIIGYLKEDGVLLSIFGLVSFILCLCIFLFQSYHFLYKSLLNSGRALSIFITLKNKNINLAIYYLLTNY